jgi:signal transduction histidine kinase
MSDHLHSGGVALSRPHTDGVPLTSVTPHDGAITRVLVAPFGRRAWVELLYAAIGFPLGIAGMIYAVVALYIGVGLSVTIVGVPLLALAVLGARQAGRLHRGLARALLGATVDDPPPFRRKPGFFGWIVSALRDGTGWRAGGYLLLRAPLAVATLVVSAFFWVYGLSGSTYSLWRAALPAERDSAGELHHGMVLGTDNYLDTWPTILGVTVAGVLLLFAAPWAVHGVLTLDRLLIRWLLGPFRGSARVRHLEQARAHAVDDSAAELRRIERDLHDGTQARLVALAMKLGMAKEELAGDGQPVDVDQARALVENAHTSAKEALVEVRDLARNIHPPALDNGLDAALTTLAARSAVPVTLEVDVPVRPSPAIETIAYYCTAELLTNVAKHSEAGHATIAVTQGTLLRVAVGDDGVGGAQLGAGTGLTGLAERVRTVDGRLEIISPPGGPTLVTIELPSHV